MVRARGAAAAWVRSARCRCCLRRASRTVRCGADGWGFARRVAARGPRAPGRGSRPCGDDPGCPGGGTLVPPLLVTPRRRLARWALSCDSPTTRRRVACAGTRSQINAPRPPRLRARPRRRRREFRDRERREHGRERDGAVRRADVAARLREADGGVPSSGATRYASVVACTGAATCGSQAAARSTSRAPSSRKAPRPPSMSPTRQHTLSGRRPRRPSHHFAGGSGHRSPRRRRGPAYALVPVFACVCARTPGDRFIGTGAPSAGMPTPAARTATSRASRRRRRARPRRPAGARPPSPPTGTSRPRPRPLSAVWPRSQMGRRAPRRDTSASAPSLVLRPGSRAAASSAVSTSTA